MKITFDVDIHNDYVEINGMKHQIRDGQYTWSSLSRSLESYLLKVIFLALSFTLLTAHLIKMYSGVMKLNTPCSTP
jgi:hypothetical protein